jgi:DNA polymerase
VPTQPSIERPGAQAFVPPEATIEELRGAATACRGCELWEPASRVVFSAGSPEARIALVGEQPGDQEDRQGIPFVGPAGRLLQQALDEVGIERTDVYVTNVVKHFRFTQSAPGKRRIHQTPDRVHVEACRPWFVAEMAIVDPDVVVCLGATAAKALLGPSFRVTQQRGQVIERETTKGVRRFVATVHPSSILRSDDRDTAYAAFVADLQVVAGAAG